MTTLQLSPDELLSTTRAVRKRLDFDRPVGDDVIRECVELAMQSPSGSNLMTMQFVVVRDPDKRAALGEIYRRQYAAYQKWDGIYIGSIERKEPDAIRQQRRSTSSADFLGDHIADAPALIIPCNRSGPLEGAPAMLTATMLANVMPAMWSFMLAARARGLGTCWTTLHLLEEEKVADLLGIPYQAVRQICMSPLAYTKGTDFKPAQRPPADTIIHWDQW